MLTVALTCAATCTAAPAFAQAVSVAPVAPPPRVEAVAAPLAGCVVYPARPACYWPAGVVY
ncbi:hypothetical protein RI103_26770 [Paraburkholderia sp. FT54]|jgi:hypothetical protein|uniref:hypothetical protein n=1 Tax=Paraburkholderia sp. FT54 TaxID=3074437 RepID=UPI0028774DD3|nr:hypothetical protein [Paraburkholderia sp. FT54]WNC94367.1 hypothetical protein RI103_26770 [Paraburkholderia sp. FT54]